MKVSHTYFITYINAKGRVWGYATICLFAANLPQYSLTILTFSFFCTSNSNFLLIVCFNSSKGLELFYLLSSSTLRREIFRGKKHLGDFVVPLLAFKKDRSALNWFSHNFLESRSRNMQQKNVINFFGYFDNNKKSSLGIHL